MMIYDHKDLKGLPLAKVNGKAIYIKNKSMNAVTDISNWAKERKDEIMLNE